MWIIIIHVHVKLIKDYFTVCYSVIVNKLKMLFQAMTLEAKLSTEFLTVLLLMFLKVLTNIINNYLWLI